MNREREILASIKQLGEVQQEMLVNLISENGGFLEKIHDSLEEKHQRIIELLEEKSNTIKSLIESLELLHKSDLEAVSKKIEETLGNMLMMSEEELKEELEDEEDS